MTEIPPQFRGDVAIGYAFDNLSGSLVEATDEGSVEVGERSMTDHRLHYAVAFGLAPGAAVFLDIPHYAASVVKYPLGADMVFNPSNDSGTYEGTTPSDLGTAAFGSGIGGIWLGARGTPFSEAFASRNNKATWLLEMGFRTPDRSDFYTVGDSGKLGAGPGSGAFRVKSAFSKTFGSATPYMVTALTSNGVFTRDIKDADGNVVVKGAEFDPGRQGDMRFGVELASPTNEETGAKFSFDMNLSFAYSSFEVVPSGFFLPNVLDSSFGQPAQMAESLEAGGGLGINWRIMEYVEWGVGGTFLYHLPQRVENYYPVSTGPNTMHTIVATDITVRIR